MLCGQCVVKCCIALLFIHCYALKLNLILAQGTNNIQAAKLFFATLDPFYSLFSHSGKRWALLCEVDRDVCEPGGSAVRRNFWIHAVHAIHEERRLLCMAFHKIMTEMGWDKETIAQSAALRQKLDDLDFTSLLVVFQSIFRLTETLFQVLQSYDSGHQKIPGSDQEHSALSKPQEQMTRSLAFMMKQSRQSDNLCPSETLSASLGGPGAGGQPAPRRRRGNCLSVFQIVDSIVLHINQRFADHIICILLQARCISQQWLSWSRRIHSMMSRS